MATLADSQPMEQMVKEPLQPGTRVGNYRLVRVLGKGGMGAVYEAAHLYIERRAAIKVLHAQLSQSSEFRTRFLNEARAVNLIKHPGLVEVYEFGLLDDGTAYIVMEFLQGESLEQHIKRHPQGLGPAAIPIAHDIAQAMVAAHQKSIVHRDLKPGNVMLTQHESGRSKADELLIKILDFGIAKMSQEVEGSLRTETGATIGTPAYMAPEQCLSAPNVDGKADVYALGIILYELLSGQLPFAAQHSFDFMAAHVRSEPRPIVDVLPDLPPEVANLVHSMLIKEPTLRPSMETVAALLQELRVAGDALWAADPLHETELGSGGQQTMGHAATLSRPSRPPWHSKERIEIGATALGLGGARLSRELALVSTPPSSQISGSARISQGASSSGRKSPASQMSHANEPAEPSAVSAPSAALPAAKDPAEPPRTWGRVAGAAAMLLALSLSGIWFAVLSKRDTHGSDGTNPAQKQPGGRMVKWQLRSQPTGAEVVRSDGQVIGSTPFQLVRPADSGESQITLRVPGHADKTVVLSHSADIETDIVLSALPTASPPKVADDAIGKSGKSTESRKAASKRGHKARKGKEADPGDVKLLMD